MLRISPERLDRLFALDARCVQRLHRCTDRRFILFWLRVASRLGDGLFWYCLIAAVAIVFGERGRTCAVHMVLAGSLGVLLVHWLKRCTARSRPYQCLRDVRLHARVLDRFSFPSGHTAHAVTFTAVLAHYYPGLALSLMPFIIVVGFSRVILGLHYPSDVLGGVAIGIVLALVTRAFI
jgi:undecaprenyl-diphosphatase